MTKEKKAALRDALFAKVSKEAELVEKNVGLQQFRMRPKGLSRSEAIVEAMIARTQCTDRMHEGSMTWFHLLKAAFTEVFAEEERDLTAEQLVKLCATALFMLESIEKRRKHP